jgi:hypothetical protein
MCPVCRGRENDIYDRPGPCFCAILGGVLSHWQTIPVSVPGLTKNCISICSNSRISGKLNWRATISLAKGFADLGNTKRKFHPSGFLPR